MPSLSEANYWPFRADTSAVARGVAPLLVPPNDPRWGRCGNCEPPNYDKPCWGCELAQDLMRQREQLKAEKDAAEQRIESLAEIARNYANQPAKGMRLILAALDTTQAEQRQAAFLARHEERMQAVDDALEADGG